MHLSLQKIIDQDLKYAIKYLLHSQCPEVEQRVQFKKTFLATGICSHATYYLDIKAKGLKGTTIDMHEIPYRRLKLWAQMLNCEISDLFTY
jgi:hypothetical protein